MSGNVNLTSGYSFGTATNPGEFVTYAKLNAIIGAAIAQIAAGAVTDTEIASVSGTKITAGTIPTSALDTATQAKFGFKNYAVNPAFEYWPYGTSFTTAGSEVAFTQGWTVTAPSGLSYSMSQQSIVAGINDTLLLDSKYYARLQTTSTNSTGVVVKNYVPNVREFSGQNITVSAIVENISGTLPALTLSATQYFGTGGSPSANVVVSGSAVTVTSNWTKISTTLSIPSITGKTVGSNGDDALIIAFNFANSSTQFYFDIANFQVETSSAATTFENAINKQWQVVEQNIAQCSGRLTLTSGTPVLTTDVTAATSVYFTPYNGNTVPLWNGYRWAIIPFSEQTISLSGWTANTVRDVFAYVSNGGLALETLVWTSQTARATGIVYYDGVLCKSGDKTRRYIGSIATTGTTGQTEMSGLAGIYATNGAIARSLVYNQNNKVEHQLRTQDTTASWTYNTIAWRVANAAGTTHFHQVLNGDQSTIYRTEYAITVDGSSGNDFAIAIGDTTTTVTAGSYTCIQSCYGRRNSRAHNRTYNIGVRTYYPLEYCFTTNTFTFYSNTFASPGGYSELLTTISC